MGIAPIIPLIGLGLLIFNVLIAALRPYMPPMVMGVQLFSAGIMTIMIAVIDLINPLGIGPFERALLFVAGCINCCGGYYMVLLEGRRNI